jgi:hypothetical protein
MTLWTLASRSSSQMSYVTGMGSAESGSLKYIVKPSSARRDLGIGARDWGQGRMIRRLTVMGCDLDRKIRRLTVTGCALA